MNKQLINKFLTIIGQSGINEVAFKHGSMQTIFLGESQNFVILNRWSLKMDFGEFEGTKYWNVLKIQKV